jgi:DNA-binding GntR family transcriptional regulator
LRPEEVDALTALADQIERVGEQGDMVAYNRADLDFHLGLLGVLGNAALVSTVRSLRVRSRLYGLTTLADSGALAPSAREHRQLLELVCAGRAAEAQRLMQQHIGHVRGSWATGARTDR